MTLHIHCGGMKAANIKMYIYRIVYALSIKTMHCVIYI